MKKIMIPAICLLSILISCEQKHAAAYENSSDVANEIAIDSAVSESELSSSAATYQDENRKFARKADVSFETQEVKKTTIEIEKKVMLFKGFVVHSNITSSILNTEEIEKSSDSIQLVRTVQKSNLMTVKIPQQKLGVFLESLDSHITFLNSRTISADEVTLEFDFQKLDKDRIDSSTQQYQGLLQQKGKIGDKSSIISSIDDKKQEKNQGIIQSKALNDKVNMSEVTLQISEQPKINRVLAPNTSNTYLKYTPDFGYRLKNAFQEGFYYLNELFFIFLRLLPTLILLVLLVIGFKTIRNYFKNRKLKK